VIAFADAFIVLTRGACKIEAEMYAKQDLMKIERWDTDNKIEFNDKRSNVLFISRKRNDDRKVNIYLNYKRLEQHEEMKYLGIYLDNKFNFNAHIDHTVAKLISLVNMLARTAKLQWGLGHKGLKTVYEGAVVPLLTYEAPIWIEAIRKNKNLTKYKRIQRLMNINIAKAYRTISYDASCVYIYIHTHIHTLIHIYTHTPTHTYTHIYIYTHTHAHTYTYTHIHKHLHTHTHTHIHIYTHIHTRTHTYTHIYTYTHTYTHIYT